MTATRTLTHWIAKLGRSIEIKTPAPMQEWLLLHGVDSKVGDSHANIKRENFKTDQEYADAVMAKVNGVVKQIEAGTLPPRRNMQPVLTDEAIAQSLGVTVEVVRQMRAAAAGATPTPAATAAADSVLIPAATPAPETPAPAAPETPAPAPTGRRSRAA